MQQLDKASCMVYTCNSCNHLSLKAKWFVELADLLYMKGVPELIEYENEKYVSASEVARRLKISRGMCKGNILPMLTECYLPGRKSILYKQSEVEELSHVRTVEKRIQPLSLVKQDHTVVHTEDNLCREAL